MEPEVNPVRSTSFPMTSFSREQDKGQSSISSQDKTRAQEDEAAEQLQRELELFAQDDNEEEGSLMASNQPGSYDHTQPQNLGHPRDDDDDENELQEYETYFDQRK